MEFGSFLRSLIGKWWIILPTFAITFTATYLFTDNQPLIYESTVTFVMRPRSSFTGDKEVVRVVDTLSRFVEINTTYAEVAMSKRIKNLAIERLGLSTQERRDLSVNSGVVAGTNILEISVQGTEPAVVRDFANAVSAETLTYVSNLYDLFELEPLDSAELPTRAIKPNKPLNLAVGGILGLVLGLVWASLFQFLLQEPAEGPVSFDIIDSETGAFNKSYLRLRLRQEMSRVKRNNYFLSLALIKISHQGMPDASLPLLPSEVLRRVTMLLRSSLREEDVLTRFDETTFALLLPDTTGQSAQVLLETVQTKIGVTSLDLSGSGSKLYIQVAAGVAAYEEDYEINPDELLARAVSALKNGASPAYSTVSLFSPANINLTEHRNGKTAVSEQSQSI
jgi:diguanylate cyclase (GGDEF)-like protein